MTQSYYGALFYLHPKTYCFVDLKPWISCYEMLNSRIYAVLIDFGETVRNSQRIIDYTRAYCLDADGMVATEHIDWICLGTTLNSSDCGP
jgi:hypothetical protein